MIALILSLMTWEWYKLRRRWMPWIMLAIAIAFSQLIFWAGFAFQSEFGQTGETLRLPDVVTEGLGFGYQIVAILIIIWAASALGSEYGWGHFPHHTGQGPRTMAIPRRTVLLDVDDGIRLDGGCRGCVRRQQCDRGDHRW